MNIIASYCCNCVSGPVFFLRPLLPIDRRRSRFVAQVTTYSLSSAHFAGQNVLRRLYVNELVVTAGSCFWEFKYE